MRKSGKILWIFPLFKFNYTFSTFFETVRMQSFSVYSRKISRSNLNISSFKISTETEKFFPLGRVILTRGHPLERTLIADTTIPLAASMSQSLSTSAGIIGISPTETVVVITPFGVINDCVIVFFFLVL